MKNKKLYITLSVVIIILVVASILSKKKDTAHNNISEVKLGSISETVEETGIVYSKRVNTFYSDISQKIETLNVSVGDRVKKGDIILAYSNNYDLEIERAKKLIEATTAEYKELASGADFEEVSNLKLNINSIENKLEFAKKNYEKLKSLLENNAISEAEVDEAKNNVTILENQLQEAINNYDYILKGISSNVKRQFEAQIDEIMIQIKILEKSKEQSIIKAEFDGIITELNVHEGSMTQAGIPVVEIQDDNNLGIYVEVLADEAAKITTDMPLNIINKENIIEKELKVNRIYPKAESKLSDLGVEQKRIRIETDMDEATNLKIGMEVDVEIIINQKENVLLVDKNAVYEKDSKKYVSLKIDSNTEEREITTGLKNNKYVEILSGLKEGDIIIY